jgi:acetylornithine/N-succinyldiaminopimelate aminotransferase
MPVPALLPTFAPFPFRIAFGRNDRVWDEEGNAYWDFYGGHCVSLTGHSHPRVVRAIQEQAEKLLFYSTAGDLAIRHRAAEELVQFAGPPFTSVFFCNSGAEANENALKLAAKMTGRNAFLAFEGGWHGRTALALAVTDDPPIREPYEGLLPKVVRVPFNDPAALKEVPWREIAGVILEPIQSMAGIVEADPSWLAAVRDACDRSGALLIFDEIQTGFGRLGAPFAKDVLHVKPDIATCAKGMASGFPMGALLVSQAIAQAVGPGDLGSTFGGAPLACAALLATLETVASEQLITSALDCERALRTGMTSAAFCKVRGRGLLLGLECLEPAELARKHFFEHTILVGGSHDPKVVRLMPPLTLSGDAIEAFCEAARAATEARA